MKKPLHPVTDHAVIRYLERVQRIDIEAIRREIGRIADRGIAAGANGVIKGGFTYRIADGCVVTVIRHNQPERGKCRKKARS